MTTRSYPLWRGVHLSATGLLGLIALIHCAMTWQLYDAWTPDAVWFLGTGLGLLLLSALNYSHIGIEPCRQPTTRLVRIANWSFLVFGLGAAWAVREPQAFVVVACLAVQAVASRVTLPGPNPVNDPT